jgi:hypothetical protein
MDAPDKYIVVRFKRPGSSDDLATGVRLQFNPTGYETTERGFREAFVRQLGPALVGYVMDEVYNALFPAAPPDAKM